MGYSILIQWSNEDGEYVATVPEFPGVSAVMPTRAGVLAEVLIALDLAVESLPPGIRSNWPGWAVTALAAGWTAPKGWKP